MAQITRAEVTGNVTKKLDMTTELPKNSYVSVCKKETFEKSKSSGNMMIVRTWEIVSPESIQINGQTIIIAGVEDIQYLPLAGTANPSKGISKAQADANALERFFAEQAKLGLNSETVDTDNPFSDENAKAEKVVADCIWASEDRSPTENPLPGEKKGKPILYQGKPVIRFGPKLVEVLGRSTTTINQAF